jgi:neutral ceramidase
MPRGRKRRRGFARVVLLAAALVCLLAVAASAYRSPKGAHPSVRILTKDQPSALAARKIALRVTVATPSRVRLRVLALDIASRPVFAVTERKVRFRRAGTQTVSLKFNKIALKGFAAAIAACRDVRLTAFASGRQTTANGDNPRTTLVRHSVALKHGRTSGCGPAGGNPGSPGVPGSPGSTPGLGGPSLEPPGTPPGGGGPPTPVPTDPITIKAGAADADSTPPVGTPMFAYTARSNIFSPGPDRPLQILADPDTNLYAKTFLPSEGIHTRIRARAIVIEAGGKKYALAMVDLGGLPYSFTKEVINRVGALGITGDRLLLSATHTHSSSGAIWSADNSGYAFVGGDAYDPRVFEMVVSGVVEAITEANKRLQPARIGVGTANLSGASHNREHDPFKLNPDATPQEKDPETGGGLAVDHRVTAIRVDDAKGAPIAVWSNFAIHPTSFGDDNLLFSGDNAATAERLVEEEILRSAAPAAQPKYTPVDVWTNGTEGDVSPDGSTATDATEPDKIGDNPNPHRNLELSNTAAGGANSAGRKVSAGIMAAWRNAGQAMSGSPVIDERSMFMNFDGRTVEGDKPTAAYPALGAGGIVSPNEGPNSIFEPDQTKAGGCSPVDDVAGPGQGKKFPIIQGPGIAPNQHPISMFRIGPLALAAWPSEITTINGRRMKAAIAAAAGANAPAGVTIAGLTNSYNSYTATPEEYNYCSYEGSFTLWGTYQSLYYRELAGGLAKALYSGAPLPAGGAEPPTASPGTPNSPSVRQTPNAKTIVTDVDKPVDRQHQAVFKWNGGDPAIDAPRSKPFVTLEHLENGKFVASSTDDSVMDTTHRASDDTWTETWQFTECDALGTYRFHVRGKAFISAPNQDYETISKPFELRKAPLKSYSTTVSNGVAHVRAEYTGLPSEALAVLDRRVRHGFAVLRVTEPGGAVNDVIALPDANRLEFRASVPAGSKVAVVSIEDACGNTGS